ncbi:MAG: TFIIB-type zinc finger domain-containing protein [Lachnospiraceae bacterium]|nr:TFIIB-type zinc finger domain-containing protein [Lachnospiraceae bacterium]
MKKLVCEQCGSVDLVKEGDLYVCQYCGCKYIPDNTGDQLVLLDGKPEAENTKSQAAALNTDSSLEYTVEKINDSEAKSKSAGTPKTVLVSLAAAAVIGLILLITIRGNNDAGSSLNEAPTAAPTIIESEITEETEGALTEQAAESETEIQGTVYDLETSEQIMKEMTGGLQVVMERMLAVTSKNPDEWDKAIANDTVIDLSANPDWTAFTEETYSWSEMVLKRDTTVLSEPFAGVCVVMQDLAVKMKSRLDSIGSQIGGKQFYIRYASLITDLDSAVKEATKILEPYGLEDEMEEEEAELQEAAVEDKTNGKISLPYVGMPERDLDSTSLGLSYYNGANHDTINGKRTTVDIYFYIQSDYGIIYVARVANGKVISVKDYRDDPWYFPMFMEGAKKNGRKKKPAN